MRFDLVQKLRDHAGLLRKIEAAAPPPGINQGPTYDLLELAANTIEQMRRDARDEAREATRAAQDAATEAYWQGKQGDDYGSY